VNEQHAVIYDGYSQRGKTFWNNLLPKVTKKVNKKKAEEFKSVETKNLKFGDVLKRQSEGTSESLLLAWRYNESIQSQEDLKSKKIKGQHLASDFKNRKCEYQFDLSHGMTSMISGHNIPINKEKYFNVVEDQFEGLNQLWESICQQYLDKQEFADDQSFFKFFIPNFLNLDLFENDDSLDQEYSCKNIIKFLRNLRALVNTMNGVFTLTIDRKSLKSNSLLNYFIKYSDLVIDLKSFSDSEDKFLDYQGSLRILKQPAINGLVGHQAEQDIYVFKSDKKKFIIETIHMDPEEDNEEVEKKDEPKVPGGLCSTNPSVNDPLDF